MLTTRISELEAVKNLIAFSDLPAAAEISPSGVETCRRIRGAMKLIDQVVAELKSAIEAGGALDSDVWTVERAMKSVLDLNTWSEEKFFVCVDGIKCYRCQDVQNGPPPKGCRAGALGNWQCAKCGGLSSLAIVKTPLGNAWRTGEQVIR